MIRWRAFCVVFGLVVVVLAWSQTGSYRSGDAAGSVTLIVRQNDRDLEVFVKAPARKLTDLFGANLSPFASQDGSVNYDIVRAGTWQHHEAVFKNLTVSFGDRLVRPELLSLMLHPPGLELPFATPFDAALAIGVCSSPETIENYTTDETDVFAGFMIQDASRVTDWQSMKFVNGAHGATDRPSSLKVGVLFFRSNQFVGKGEAVWDGRTLELPRPPHVATSR